MKKKLRGPIFGCLVGCTIAAAGVARWRAPLPIAGGLGAPRAGGTQTGVLRGTVVLDGGEIPPPTRIENTTDPAICGRFHEVKDLLVSAGNRGVQNVIVSLVASRSNASSHAPAPGRSLATGRGGEERGSAAGAPPSELLLENRDCEFAPRVAVLTVGDSIRVVSHDETLHTVHLYGAVERNIALPSPSTSATVPIDRTGMITVLCDVHGWMRAFVRVDPHSHHAVTDGIGYFVIRDVPVGRYEVELWHERLGGAPRAVRIDAGQTLNVEMHMSLKER